MYTYLLNSSLYVADPDKGEVKFEADPNALQSILQNQGLTNGPQGVMPARQTLAVPQRNPIVGPSLPRPTVSNFVETFTYKQCVQNFT